MAPVPTRKRPSGCDGLAGFWNSYQRQLQLHPLRTKAVTSAVIFAISDWISQLLGARSLSLRRNLFVAMWGALWSAPTTHAWQNMMQRFSQKTDMLTVLMKVAFDQLTFGPINNIANMAFFTLLVENKGVRHLSSKVASEYPRIQLNGWKLWPAAALFNYRFMPLHLRVLFLNLVALGWTTFVNVAATKGTDVKSK